MEENQITSNPEDVNEGNASEPTNDVKEGEGKPEAQDGKESGDSKIKEDLENIKKALHEEREKRKSYEKEKSDAERKEKLKKGKHEEVIGEMEKRTQELEAELIDARKFKESYVAEKKVQIESLVAQIPADKKEFVGKIIEGKNEKDTVDILSEFAAQYKKPEYSPKPNGANEIGSNNGGEFEKSKAKGDLKGMLADISKGMLGT